ncbi:17760_t:CDS:2 [Funneliformis caledonium]|uniref:17760_t:CDS:1 n=1 Tax=Funneliformis caledonium TaxID=1117310 RepID=A0A9N8YRY2_9GLOM|nr:17760_t:CDS:2 [Funneliformis caledonium]
MRDKILLDSQQKHKDKTSQRLTSRAFYSANCVSRTSYYQQLKEAEDFNKKFSIGSIQSIGSAFTYETHPKAIYTSRLLQFNSLPEPRNADDYYEHYDNLSSMEYLESVQLDPSQLNINDFKHT